MTPAFALTHAAANDTEEILEYVADRGGDGPAERVREGLYDAFVFLQVSGGRPHAH